MRADCTPVLDLTEGFGISAAKAQPVNVRFGSERAECAVH
jgi:hypothetical protein